MNAAADADDPESRRLCRLPDVLPGQQVGVEKQLADGSISDSSSLFPHESWSPSSQPVQVQVDDDEEGLIKKVLI